MRLIDNWQRELGRLWSLRVVLGSVVFWSALGGLWVLWPALVAVLPLWFYITAGLLMSIALGVARVLKQPGAE